MQAMRKDAGFDIADRITTYYRSNKDLEQVISAWGEYIQSETLTTELHAALPPAEAYTEEHMIDGEPLLLGVRRN